MTYTQIAVMAVAIALVLDVGLRTRLITRKVFWVSYAIILFFQLVSNGVLTASGFDAAAFAALTADPAVKQGLVANTEEAVARGVFGAPTMFVGDEMHFGQDRLDFVAQALAR